MTRAALTVIGTRVYRHVGSARCRELHTCHVVGAGCNAPPFAVESDARTECFACGNYVCTNSTCSRRVRYFRYGRRRLCTHCIEENARKDV